MLHLINWLLTRKQPTQRVDDMASSAARAALDQRLNRLFMLQANQPTPQPRQFAMLNERGWSE